MKNDKKEVALLVSDKNSPFVLFLTYYFSGKGIKTKVFDSRNSLYLFLITHDPMSILISRQIKTKNSKAVAAWVKKKYDICAVLFDEKDMSSEKENDYLDILKKAKPLPERHDDFDLFTNYIEGILIELKNSVQQHQNSSDPSINKLFSMIGDYIDMKAQKVEGTTATTHVLPMQRENDSGYLFVDTDNKETVDKLVKKFDAGVDIQPGFSSPSLSEDKLEREFLGSVEIDNEHVNTYGLKCKLPDFKITESNNMLETDVVYFSSENPVDFDVYLHMENNNKDFHYLSPGSAFSEDQLENLSHKNKRVRIRKEDKNKLVSHLNISYAMQVSSPGLKDIKDKKSI